MITSRDRPTATMAFFFPRRRAMRRSVHRGRCPCVRRRRRPRPAVGPGSGCRARSTAPARLLQIDDLESLPGWTWRGPDERWRQGIAALRAYFLRYGCAQPPQRAVVDGSPIGAWVQGCRRDYRQGALSAEHVAELEFDTDLGVVGQAPTGEGLNCWSAVVTVGDRHRSGSRPRAAAPCARRWRFVLRRRSSAAGNNLELAIAVAIATLGSPPAKPWRGLSAR